MKTVSIIEGRETGNREQGTDFRESLNPEICSLNLVRKAGDEFGTPDP